MSWSRLALVERGGGVVRVGVEASGVVPLFLVVLREGEPVFSGDGGPTWEVPDLGGNLSVVVGHWEGAEAFADDTRELAAEGSMLIPFLGVTSLLVGLMGASRSSPGVLGLVALGFSVVAFAKR